ncbi:hypothetical protein QQ045_018050 [Rhodiola kirilowii]
MAIPTEPRGVIARRMTSSFLIPSPLDHPKSRTAQECTQGEAARAGVKSAAIACVVSAVPTLIAVRKIPWAKANLNYTAQALIISGGSSTAVFTLLHAANCIDKFNKALTLPYSGKSVFLQLGRDKMAILSEGMSSCNKVPSSEVVIKRSLVAADTNMLQRKFMVYINSFEHWCIMKQSGSNLTQVSKTDFGTLN